ncbi:uncharacterized protein LOC122085557 [Macadamia integrifolia]|uniref:uncharacterized protein LOC122085557 n=1 Tax=Macadamia integrifolia TaxID=60698 RepID=UPI001C4FBDF4|nr:uncharacterized protein LOC122085557 [Macadamia integrifolia]
MKTIKGSITSSNPISLSKAASVLHKFINEDTGASQAVSVYLKRASAAFEELVEFHNELKGRSHRKHKKIRMETLDNGALKDAETNHEEEGTTAAERGRFIDSLEEQSDRNSGKPKGGGFDDEGINRQRKKKKDFSDYGPEAKVGEGGAGIRIVEETKKRKKKEVEDGGLNDYEEQHSRKNKKIVDGGLNDYEEQHSRKNKKVVDGGLNDYEERHIRKNKKSKRRNEDEK